VQAGYDDDDDGDCVGVGVGVGLALTEGLGIGVGVRVGTGVGVGNGVVLRGAVGVKVGVGAGVGAVERSRQTKNTKTLASNRADAGAERIRLSNQAASQMRGLGAEMIAESEHSLS